MIFAGKFSIQHTCSLNFGNCNNLKQPVMERKRLCFILPAIVVTSLALTLSSCTKDDDALSLEGSWMALFELPEEAPMQPMSDAIFLNFDKGVIEIFTFLNGDQVTGASGTYTFDKSDGVMDIVFTSLWVAVNGTRGWVGIPEQDQTAVSSDVTFSDDGDILYFAQPGESTLQFPLHRCEPELVPEMAGEWLGDEVIEITIHPNSTLEAASYGGYETGYIRKIDGVGGKDFLLIHITSLEGVPRSDRKLYEYTFDADEMVITLKAIEFLMELVPLTP